MGIKVYFPGKKKVYADVGDFTIETDQHPRGGGEGSAPEPFTYFLASIATCGGIFVKSFCDSRNIPADDIELEQNLKFDPIKQKISQIQIDIKVPDTFPQKYYDALVRAVDQCSVKRMMFDPPEFDVKTVVKE